MELIISPKNANFALFECIRVRSRMFTDVVNHHLTAFDLTSFEMYQTCIAFTITLICNTAGACSHQAKKKETLRKRFGYLSAIYIYTLTPGRSLVDSNYLLHPCVSAVYIEL